MPAVRGRCLSRRTPTAVGIVWWLYGEGDEISPSLGCGRERKRTSTQPVAFAIAADTQVGSRGSRAKSPSTCRVVGRTVGLKKEAPNMCLSLV
jgi:hypothetical protein